MQQNLAARTSRYDTNGCQQVEISTTMAKHGLDNTNASAVL